MTINISRNDDATSIGAESIAYIAECIISPQERESGTKTIPAVSGTWREFPCVIGEKLDMEPKTGELLDDRGRIVHSYSQPSKVKYSGSIFQRDSNTFEYLRNNANKTFVMWVVVGMIGTANQEILMYGKLGGNYSEDMSAEPKIPIEFNCLVNNVDIIITAKPGSKCLADLSSSATVILKAKQMVKKIDSDIDDGTIIDYDPS